MAGARYYFTESFFGMLETGAHLFRASAEVYDVYNTEQFSKEYKTKFGAGAGAGFRHQLAEPSAFEFSGIFHFVQDDLNSIVLRATIIIFLDNI